MSSLINFDPKLKYETIGYLENGSFGLTTLVQIKSNSSSHTLAMKRVNLLDQEQSTRQTPKTPQVSASRNSRLSQISLMESSERERLSKSLKKLKSSQHENLIYLIDVFLAKDCKSIHLVSEFCKEDSLKARLTLYKLHKTQVSNTLLYKWFNETISGLNYLHQREILHANVKPSNFLLSGGDRIKLSDFGYLTLFNEKAQKLYLNKFLVENNYFVPPETIDKNEYSDLSDVYAVACVFHEVLFSEPYNPLRGDLKTELKIRCSNDHFTQALVSMLQKQPLSRPNTQSLVKFNHLNALFCDSNTQILKKGLFTVTYLIKKHVLKQIPLADRNLSIIQAFFTNILKLNQNNVMPMYDYVFIHKRLYLIHEYQSNGNLSGKIDTQISQGTKFLENLILQWLLQISNGLQYLHRNSIIHGNLKCENVLFTRGNLIKLSDFGYYHLLVHDSNVSIHNISTEYSPPEIIYSKGNLYKYTLKSDVFSFGAILCKCLTFRHYYDLLNDDFSDRQSNSSLESLRPKTALSTHSNVDYKVKLLGQDYTFNLRSNVIQMLREKPFERPTLDDLVSNLRNLVSVNYSKLLTTQPITIEFNGKIKIFLSRSLSENSNDFLMITKTSPIEPKKNSSFIHIDRIYTCSQLKLNNGTLVKKELTQVHIPKLVCLLNDTYLIGCDIDCLSVYDTDFKLIKSVQLNDLLWSKLKVDLGTDIQLKSLCSDSRSNRLYLLFTVKQSTTHLATFDLNFSIITNTIHKTKQEEELELFTSLKKHKNQFEYERLVKKYLENLTANRANDKTFETITFDLKVYAINSLSISSIGSKVTFASSNYLFICERERIVRVFSKENGRYVFSLKVSGHDQLNSHFPIDICGDANGNLYVAYSNTIQVYNDKGEFIWKHEIPLKMGSIRRIAINKIGSLAFITCFNYNDSFKSQLFIYP